MEEAYQFFKNLINEDRLNLITRFPVINTTEAITTRSSVQSDTFKLILEWTGDTDIDDIITFSIEEGGLRIDYKTIVALLSIYNRGFIDKDTFIKRYSENQQIQPLLKESLEKGGVGYDKYVLSKLVLNICKLTAHLNSMQSCQTIYNDSIENSIENSCISIFRGFDPERYNIFFKDLEISNEGPIDVHDTIVTPTFLSTSININTALRFTNDYGIVWEIRIKKEVWNKFRYTFLGLGEEEDDTFDFDTTKQSTKEDEMLLNISSKLICTKIISNKTLSYKTHDDVVSEITNITYYIFDFVCYDPTPIDIKKLLRFLDISSIEDMRIGINESYSDVISLGGKRTKRKKRKKRTNKYRK